MTCRSRFSSLAAVLLAGMILTHCAPPPPPPAKGKVKITVDSDCDGPVPKAVGFDASLKNDTEESAVTQHRETKVGEEEQVELGWSGNKPPTKLKIKSLQRLDGLGICEPCLQCIKDVNVSDTANGAPRARKQLDPDKKCKEQTPPANGEYIVDWPAEGAAELKITCKCQAGG